MELRADGVFLLRTRDAHTEKAVILEVQRQWDDRKRFTWPAYAMQTRATHECPAIVLVVAFDPAVARRARQPIALDHGLRWRARVLGPDSIPRIEDPDVFRAHLTLGLLSALAHNREPEDYPVAKAAWNVLLDDPAHDERFEYYFDLIEEGFGPALRALWEEHMRQGDLRQHGPTITSFINKGREEGRHMGLEEGSLNALRASVRAVLSARQIVLNDLQSGSVAECTDPQRLSQWLGRAATASSAADVFVTE